VAPLRSTGHSLWHCRLTRGGATRSRSSQRCRRRRWRSRHRRGLAGDAAGLGD
jgi:hypothetical protein